MKEYVYLLDSLNYIKYSSYKKLGQKSDNLLHCIVRLFLHIAKSLIVGKLRFLKVEKDILFVAPTLNNQKTILPIVNNLNKDTYIMLDDYNSFYPQALISLYSLRYIFNFIIYYLSKSSEDKALIRYFFQDFFTTIGCYRATNLFLKKNSNIKVIVFANDHIMQNLCLIHFAKKYNIPTIYTQHASITDRFPSLQFTYSFLDGMESWEKYKKIGGVKSTIFLSGSPRFDIIHTIRQKKKQKQSVGIALNMWDSNELVMQLCTYIRSKCDKLIIVRPHPALENKDWSIFTDIGIAISLPSKESAFSFISNLDLLIANESSIHLDAALMNIPTILYNFSENKIVDWYSYIKNGLITIANSKEDVVNTIWGLNSINVNKSKVQYYVASFGTLYEGKIGKHIADFIQCLLNNDEWSFIEKNYIFNKDCYVLK